MFMVCVKVCMCVFECFICKHTHTTVLGQGFPMLLQLPPQNHQQLWSECVCVHNAPPPPPPPPPFPGLVWSLECIKFFILSYFLASLVSVLRFALTDAEERQNIERPGISHHVIDVRWTLEECGLTTNKF